MSDVNIFGGKNAKSVYAPMSETEQELISRLVAARELNVLILDWGHMIGPPCVFGDSILSVLVSMNLTAPEVPIPVSFLDLELRTQSGVFLFRDRQPTIFNGAPLLLGAGVDFQFSWDIAIRRIDPQTLKALMPGALGLTSRFTDKDTGDLTLEGNQKLSSKQRNLLKLMKAGEDKIRKASSAEVAKAVGIAARNGFKV